MGSNFITALRVFIVYAALLGIAYPLLITVIGHFCMPEKANGSLVVQNGQVIGSTLIGQNFTDAKYFHGRFSAVNYDAANSGADNLGPSNKKLVAMAASRIKEIREENAVANSVDLPADMILTSGSGLDPQISITNAMLQAPRVAKSRGTPLQKLKKLIVKNVDPDFVGIWGQAGVNVLKLNLALDAKYDKPDRRDKSIAASSDKAPSD